MSVIKIAFYSHDTMGLGHIRRNMLLANAILATVPDAEILLINGSRSSGMYHLSQGIDTLILPGYRKTLTDRYEPLSLGKDIHHLVELRAKIIYSALEIFAPNIFIVDNVPRGAMSELDRTLNLLKYNNSHLILGLRDIIDDPYCVNDLWSKLNNVETITQFYDDVWIYGDKTFYDIREYYHFNKAVKNKITFLGYLNPVQFSQQRNSSLTIELMRKPFVLCMDGGGQDGIRLSSIFSQARFPEKMHGLLVAGPAMPEKHYAFLLKKTHIRDDLSVIRVTDSPLELMAKAESIIAMGGYNTLVEILSLHKRGLIIPRVRPRKEQWIRASLFAQKNLISCIHPDEFTLEKLNAWLLSGWLPDTPEKHLNMDGVKSFTDKINALLSSVPC